ncbi:MAG: transcription elongation factor GreA [Dehalococcoidales bacterium]|nr:MAG: transcription elongation factor GreA [Dehalococcoidales bacterium]
MSDGNPNLGEAASIFLASLSAEKRTASQQEVYKFNRWFGRERFFDSIKPSEIDNYSERVSRTDPGHAEKLALVRAFLSYARKKGWSEINLGTHLKAKKGKTRSTSKGRKEVIEPISVTKEGYEKLQAELASLNNQRQEAIEEMTKAAADKDFRENAPLHAAREKRGMLEGRIVELEATLKAAEIIDEENQSSEGVDIGKTFVLADPEKGIEMRYTLVGPREADPGNSRISSVSPIGKAVLGKKKGEMVEIDAPAGKLRYQLKEIVG